MKIMYIKAAGGCRPGDIKEVKAGYARNYLIPQGLAISADDKEVAIWQKKLANVKKVVKQKQLKTDKLAKTLANATINLELKANDQGHLYAAVADKQLQTAIGEQFGLDLSGHNIVLLTNVKQVGKQDAELKVNQTKINIHLNITPQHEAAAH